jgi:hypothetical protein
MLGLLAACAGTAELANGDVGAEEVLVGAEETGTLGQELLAGLPVGATLRTTANLNLRSGPSLSDVIRTVIPAGVDVITVNTTTPRSGWYNIKFNGLEGWSYGAYLKVVSSGGGSGGAGGGVGSGGTTTGRDEFIARAQSGVGFSYRWGHGSWIPHGASSSTSGSCTGSCPSCSHVGRYGADCSGYIAKIWTVPSSNTDRTSDAHPYSTVSFKGSNSQWRTVARDAAQKGDALVYNENGAGHIFLFESGDAWGSMWTYEARGCSYGIVHNIRTAGSAYKAIARN